MVPLPVSSIQLKARVISCTHLKAFNFFHKLSIYAVVSVSTVGEDDDDNNVPLPNTSKKEQLLQKHKTPVDKQGDGNPEWNHDILFDLKAIDCTSTSSLFLKFQMRCQGLIYGNNTIGQVSVPFSDLMADGSVRFLSYQVRTTDGRPNGVLNFSYCYNMVVDGKMINKNDSPDPDPDPAPAIPKTNNNNNACSNHSPAIPNINNNNNTKIHYPVVESIPPEIQLIIPSEKVCYPTVEVDISDPCSFSFQNQKFCDPVSGICEVRLPPPPPPPARMDMVPSPWAYYHLPPPPPPNGYYFCDSVGYNR